MSQPGQPIVVAGGGVIGTAIAWRAAAGGLSVTVVDPDRGDAASEVAAGMLAPVSESIVGEKDLLRLNLLAVARFPGFNAELERATGQITGLRREGTLAVAYDKDDHAALRRLTAFRRQLGLRTEELDARGCRELEPFLAPGVQGGVLALGDLSVDNRRYAAALRAAAAAAGVRFVGGAVTQVSESGGTIEGVRVTAAGPGSTDGSVAGSGGPKGGGAPLGGAAAGFIPAGAVVLAAGWSTGQIGGVPGFLRTAIRPVKGQILRLRHPPDMPPVLTRTVRAIVKGTEVYLVPRADGEIVVGATQEERADRDVTAGGVHDLLHDAMNLLPALSELTLAEAAAGLRPGSTDNGPVVGEIRPGLIVAAGHFRNGIMLSAATADAVAGLLAGGQPVPEWKPFVPGRFA